jgi:hypothetical protein
MKIRFLMFGIFFSLVATVLALVATDDRMGGISWSLSVPNMIAFCAIFLTLSLMARNAKNTLQ